MNNITKTGFFAILLVFVLFGASWSFSTNVSQGNRAPAIENNVNLNNRPILNNTAIAPLQKKAPSFLDLPAGSKVVLLDAPVFLESVNVVIDQLEAARKSGVKHVYLVITSPGGSVLAGGYLVAYMDTTPMQIDTVCKLFCASMAAHIHRAGKVRYMMDRSVLMFHRASGGTEGTLEQMDAEIAMYKLYVDRMDANAATRSGIPFAQFKEISGRDLWIDSQSALEMRLTDKITFLSYDASGLDIFSVKAYLRDNKIVTPKNVLDSIPASLRNLQ